MDIRVCIDFQQAGFLHWSWMSQLCFKIPMDQGFQVRGHQFLFFAYMPETIKATVKMDQTKLVDHEILYKQGINTFSLRITILELSRILIRCITWREFEVISRLKSTNAPIKEFSSLPKFIWCYISFDAL